MEGKCQRIEANETIQLLLTGNRKSTLGVYSTLWYNTINRVSMAWINWAPGQFTFLHCWYSWGRDGRPRGGSQRQSRRSSYKSEYATSIRIISRLYPNNFWELPQEHFGSKCIYILAGHLEWTILRACFLVKLAERSGDWDTMRDVPIVPSHSPYDLKSSRSELHE